MLLLRCFLFLFLAPCFAAALAAQEYLDDPNAFFSVSEPTLVEESGGVRLKLTTPLPVLCAVHYISKNEDLTQEWNVQTMDMTAPAKIHSVELPRLDDDSVEYKIALTAFLAGPSRAVLVSSTYSANISTTPLTLLVDDPMGAASPSVSDCMYDLEVSETSVGSASLKLSDSLPLPAVYSLAYGLESAASFTDISRESSTTAINSLSLSLEGLEAETRYSVEGCFLDTVREICCTPPVSLTTQASVEEYNSCLGLNIALIAKGATIFEVSSNWSNQNNDGSFGANNAIDGNPSSEWSSNADGDGAFITIKLPSLQRIGGVGVWSRTMGTSSEIKTFQLTLINFDDYGSLNAGGTGAPYYREPLELKDTTQLYTFDITDTYGREEGDIPMVDMIRLDVLASTDFNTGLRSFEVYPLIDGCDFTTNLTDPTDAPTSSLDISGDEPSDDSSGLRIGGFLAMLFFPIAITLLK